MARTMTELEAANERSARRANRNGHWGRSVASRLAAALLLGASPVAAEEYEKERSGHPLRVLAYVVHPIGVILDTLIFRPFHWLGSKEPIKTLFGQED